MAMTLEEVRNNLRASAVHADTDFDAKWANDLADSIDAHLSAQAKVRVTSRQPDAYIAQQKVHGETHMDLVWEDGEDEMKEYIPLYRELDRDAFMNLVHLKFQSGNSVPVERITIRRDEYESFAARLSPAVSDADTSIIPLEDRTPCSHGTDYTSGYKNGITVGWNNCREAVEANLEKQIAARLSQGAQGEAVTPTVDEIEKGIAPIARIDFAQPIPRIVWFKQIPQKTGELDVYTHPAERAAVPDGWVLHALRCAKAIDREAWDKGGVANISLESVKALSRALEHIELDQLTAAPQPPEGARVVGGWRERERLALRHLKEALHGFEVEMEHAPLMPPATYLEKVTLSREFQPGQGHIVADNLRALLAGNPRLGESE